MTILNEKPRTVGEAAEWQRLRTGAPDPSIKVDEALIAEREAMDLTELAKWPEKAAEAERLADESHLHQAILEVRSAMDTKRAFATFAEAAATIAAQVVRKAAAALEPVDATIAQAAQDVADLEAALDRCPPQDLARSRQLAEKVAAARTAHTRVLATRTEPAQALATAQANLRAAQAEAAAKAAEFDQERLKLNDPLHMVKGPAWARRIVQTAARTIARQQVGLPVHPDDVPVSVAALTEQIRPYGVFRHAAHQGAQEAMREIHRGAMVLPPAGSPRLT